VTLVLRRYRLPRFFKKSALSNQTLNRRSLSSERSDLKWGGEGRRGEERGGEGSEQAVILKIFPNFYRAIF
jgi:hypothetical protein